MKEEETMKKTTFSFFPDFFIFSLPRGFRFRFENFIP